MGERGVAGGRIGRQVVGARGVVQSVERVGDSGPGSKPGGRAASGGWSIAARARGDLVWRGGADGASTWAAAPRMACGRPRAPRLQPSQPGGGSPLPGPRGARAAHSPRTGDVSSTQTATQSRLGCPPAARRPGQPLSASGLLFPRLPVVWFRVSRTQHSHLTRLGGPWPAEAHTHPLASAPPGPAARNALSLMRSSVRACGGSNRCIVPTGVFV